MITAPPSSATSFSELSELEACWDLCYRTVFFLRWLCHPFLALWGLRLLFNQPACMNHGVWSSTPRLGCMLFTSVLRARHHKLGPAHVHTHTHTDTMANIHKYNTFWVWRCVVYWAACVCRWLNSCIYKCVMCTRVLVCYICMSLHPSLWCLPHSGAAILLLRWCENFYFSILLSAPDGTQFPPPSHPYWFIITYFDYLSMGSHINPKHYCCREIKRPSLE